MQIGVVFPQTEIGGAVADVREYASRVEQLGFEHVVAYDHVVGADPKVHAPWHGPYDIDTTFHEPFVLFGYLGYVARARHGHHHPSATTDRSRGQASRRS